MILTSIWDFLTSLGFPNKPNKNLICNLRMKKFNSPQPLLLLLLIALIHFSCSKDTDLMAEYIIADSINVEQQSSQNNSSENSGSNSSNDSQENSSNNSPGGDYQMGELKAFPGAEGFGKFATGGRGGAVVEVTNLNDSGAGSLREALEMKGTRTIIFRVGGTIRSAGSDYYQIPPGSGNVTIAGETAPGDGILIRGSRLRVRASNVIIRNIRFRQDPSTSTGSNDDAITLDGSGLSEPLTNIVLDHCSVSYGLDGNLDIRNTWGATIQNCIFSYNNRSNLINANSKDISYIKNIFALVNQRAVRANTIAHLDLTYELTNNYIYSVNWPGGPSEGLKVTVENNICEESIQAPSESNNFVSIAAPNPDNKEPNTIENTYLYINGNDYKDSYTNDLKPGFSEYRRSTPLYRSTYSPVSTSGLKEYLLSNAGAYANLPQGLDALDQEVISHIRSKTGEWRSSGLFPNISNGTPYPDSDNDGMDDIWEESVGLVIGVKDNNGDRDGDGYTNLEEFLFSLTQ